MRADGGGLGMRPDGLPVARIGFECDGCSRVGRLMMSRERDRERERI